MLSSLLLLLLFQLFWLKNEYADQRERLSKEADYILANTIRSVAREAMIHLAGATSSDTINKLVFTDLRSSQVDFGSTFDSIPIRTNGLKIIKGDPFLQSDSTQVVSFVKGDVTKINELMTNPKMTVHTQITGQPEDLPGLLSMIIKMEDKSSNRSLLDTSLQNKVLDSLVEVKFVEAIKASQLPQQYHLIAGQEEKIAGHDFQTEVQRDFLTGRSYLVSFHNYRGDLLAQIWPQILFALLLFSCIALAFFIIYQSLQQQRRLTALKNDFISNVTHELKTPITTVGVAIEAMSNFDALQNPERTKEYLDISKLELNRLAILVDKVLKMSLFEKGEPELKMEMLDLKELTQEILNSWKLQFERLAAKVEFNSVGNNFLLKGDRIHLTSVLYNLIDNALKYSPQQPKVDIDIHPHEDGIELKVSDQGMGIASEYKDKIFEKFFRVPTGDAHNIKGYGLGLSYVASVIHKHQGSIKVNSEQGKGTTFIVFLPRQLS